MDLKTTIEPYEFLVRFRDGKIAGASIQEIVVVRDDVGNLITETPLHVKPITEKTEFPLSQLLDETQIEALATIEDLRSELKEAQNRIGEQENELNMKNAAITELNRQLTESA